MPASSRRSCRNDPVEPWRAIFPSRPTVAGSGQAELKRECTHMPKLVETILDALMRGRVNV